MQGACSHAASHQLACRLLSSIQTALDAVVLHQALLVQVNIPFEILHDNALQALNVLVKSSGLFKHGISHFSYDDDLTNYPCQAGEGTSFCLGRRRIVFLFRMPLATAPYLREPEDAPASEHRRTLSLSSYGLVAA